VGLVRDRLRYAAVARDHRLLDDLVAIHEDIAEGRLRTRSAAELAG
jgi:hypothetical protein